MDKTGASSTPRKPSGEKAAPESFESPSTTSSESSSPSARDNHSPESPAAQSSPAAEPKTADEVTSSAPTAEEGEVTEDAPPLPNEPVPQPEDDGWEFHWRDDFNRYIFYNRFTQQWQWENPRVPTAANTETTSSTAPGLVPAGTPAASTSAPSTMSAVGSVAGGYNPAIHGDYDPNAWYAQINKPSSPPEESSTLPDPAALYASTGQFNRRTGAWQAPDQAPERHGDEAKSRRQMDAFFDVDAAANSHDGRSLRAERAGRRLTKAELKAFKEKRKAKKEEKRRAWLRD